jgi:hypothetical protein
VFTAEPRRFFLCADRAFAVGGARAALQVRLATPGTGSGIRLSWSYYLGGDSWQPLGESSATQESAGPSGFDFRDRTQAFTRDGEISFRVPQDWPVELYSTRSGRWLRVDVSAGQYQTGPVAAGIAVGYGWELPELGQITVVCRPSVAAEPLPPLAAFSNTSPIDLSKDFYPLGQQPVFNDTFYVACPDTLAWPGATVRLSVTLTNPQPPPSPPPGAPPPVYAGGDAKIAWEVSDGTLWHATEADYNLTEHGHVTITLPAPLARTAVNGDEAHWLRARLVSGGYGDPAHYSEDEHGGFILVPATLAPPVIKELSFTAPNASELQAPVTACLTYNNFGYADETIPATTPDAHDAFTPFVPAADADPALYLGFDRPPRERPVTLFLAVQPPLPEQVATLRLAGDGPSAPPRLTWDYGSTQGWQPLAAADETRALSRQGLVTFTGPPNLAVRSCFGQELAWLRLRWLGGKFPLPPGLRRVLPGTTWAAQVTTVTNEILGSSNGDPWQTFFTAQAPVQPGQQVVVGEAPPPLLEQRTLVLVEEAGAVTRITSPEGQPEQVWVRWLAVADFYESGPQDRHYTVDPLSGEIRFGDGVHGMTPPAGQNNIRITYRTGGGEQGNQAAGTIAELKSSVPAIDGVTNNEPAEGGAPAEPLGRLQARGPHLLRHRGRGIAAQDQEDLAVAASADVARAVAIVPIFNPYSLWLDPVDPRPTPEHAAAHAGRMGVVVVQGGTSAVRPAPSLGLLREVDEYLRSRCPPTAALWVAGPEWIAVNVTARVAVMSAEEADPVRDLARAELDRFLHPLTGGPHGEGWAFGSWPHTSEVSALLEAAEGLDHVISLNVSYRPDTDEERSSRLLEILQRPLTERPIPPESEPDVWHWLDRALVYSGKHDVTVELAHTEDQTAEAADADPPA